MSNGRRDRDERRRVAAVQSWTGGPTRSARPAVLEQEVINLPTPINLSGLILVQTALETDLKTIMGGCA